MFSNESWVWAYGRHIRVQPKTRWNAGNSIMPRTWDSADQRSYGVQFHIAACLHYYSFKETWMLKATSTIFYIVEPFAIPYLYLQLENPIFHQANARPHTTVGTTFVTRNLPVFLDQLVLLNFHPMNMYGPW